jgi:hypothetical protein
VSVGGVLVGVVDTVGDDDGAVAMIKVTTVSDGTR